MSYTEPLVDALPYIDHGYDEPGVREAVFAMIDEETKRYKPTKNYLEHLPEMRLSDFETEALKNEMTRLANREPMQPLSMKRYDLPGPPPGKLTDIQAWTDAVNNSQAQLEHQAIRISNLAVMNKYGSEAWKTCNTVLNAAVERQQKELAAVKKSVQEINWQRKSDQLNTGEKLKSLEAKWVSLVSKNYDIEQACDNLELEIARLSKRVEPPSAEEEQVTNGNNHNSENEPPQSNQ